MSFIYLLIFHFFFLNISSVFQPVRPLYVAFLHSTWPWSTHYSCDNIWWWNLHMTVTVDILCVANLKMAWTRWKKTRTLKPQNLCCALLHRIRWLATLTREQLISRTNKNNDKRIKSMSNLTSTLNHSEANKRTGIKMMRFHVEMKLTWKWKIWHNANGMAWSVHIQHFCRL